MAGLYASNNKDLNEKDLNDKVLNDKGLNDKGLQLVRLENSHAEPAISECNYQSVSRGFTPEKLVTRSRWPAIKK